MTSADQFLTHLSASVNSGAVYVACPAPSGKGWIREVWKPGRPLLSPQTYYSPCTVKLLSPHGNKVRARADDLDQCFAIVLDDVGTKIDPLLIELEPTYVLETSPGNFQWGFLLIEPVPAARGNRIVEALIAAGWTDGGRPNLCGQVMRLPGSVNVKREPHFVARLVIENWDIIWSINDFEALFHLTGDVALVVAASVLPRLPDGVVDPVLEWLSAEGMVLGEADGRGWVPIECPWSAGHSTEGGTDYFPGAPGAFKCLHEHCAGRTTGDLKEWIRGQDAAFTDTPDLDTVTASLGAALRKIRDTSVGELSLLEKMRRQIEPIFLAPQVLPDFETTQRGQPCQGQTTTCVRVEHVMGLIGMKARFNMMSKEVELLMGDYISAGDQQDAGVETLLHACARCGMKNEMSIRAAIGNIAKGDMYNPVWDWIHASPWDGRDRMEALFASVKLRRPSKTVVDNATLETWKRVAMRKWFIQAYVAIGNYRRKQGPQSVPYVLTLQGRERRGKSKWVASLLPEPWVSVGLTMKLDGFSSERDTVRRATRWPIGELGELDASFRRSDHSGMKNFLSTTVDLYRDAYARNITAIPRCTAFCATVNPQGFLIGQEGESRFWVLGVDCCDFEHGINLQQLWAQIATLGEEFELTRDEWDLHAKMVKTFMADSDVNTIIDDLNFRRLAIPNVTEPTNNWVVANARELMAQHQVQQRFATRVDLNAALAREGYQKTILDGKTGFRVPPFCGELTSEQRRRGEMAQRSLHVVDGGMS